MNTLGWIVFAVVIGASVLWLWAALKLLAEEAEEVAKLKRESEA
jgi:hypothetical protein